MAMGRFYTASFDNVTVSAAQDLFEVTPADDKPIALCGLTLDNVGGTADAADAQEELLRLSIIRGFTSSGSGGTTPTPAGGCPLRFNDTVPGFVTELNNTSLATTGTTHTLMNFGWNVRVPLREFWPEELWPGATQANTTIVVRLVTAPADAVSVSGTLFLCEFV
jgi:hypothetical protein